MKKSLSVVSIIGLGFGLVACATSENHPIANQTTDFTANRRVAQDATVEYTTDTRDLEKVCGHAPEAKVGVPPNQIRLTSRQEAVTRFTVSTPVYDCETTEGNGKGGDWHGFYDTPGDKADMLHKSIKGVGEVTGPLLVPYFQAGKPRSWTAFSDLITSAAKELQTKNGLNPAWTNGVLYRYKEVNMKNLGYMGSTGCTVVRTEDKTYEERAFIADLVVTVETRIRGSKLLPGECDSYTVSWNGREVTGTATSDFNHYAVTTNYDALTADLSDGRKAIVTYKGDRVAVNPGYLMEIPGSTAVGNGNSVQITVRNSGLNAMMGVPEFANSCKLSASVVISGRSGSAWSGKKTKALKSATFPLDGTSGSTNYTAAGVALDAKQHPVVRISTSFAPGCPFYNTATIDNGTIEE